MTTYNRIALIGIEPEEYQELAARYNGLILWHQLLPKIAVKEGVLYVEKSSGVGMLPVDKVVYYGIYDNDFDFITGLALWGGPCFPNARAMMECRMKIPCLIKALSLTRFGAPRGFLSAGAEINMNDATVAKWGNWHCGENKHLFTGAWQCEEVATLEPFYPGDAVRIMMIGSTAWQIKLEGDSWLKSIHPDTAGFMPIDEALYEDTLHIKRALQLDMIGNDYIVGTDGTKRLLEVNHIPNITRFTEVRTAYLDAVTVWLQH